MPEPLSVLVVDDDEVFLQQFAAFITGQGHRAVAVPSTPRAVAELERREFGVVFTDLRMPRHGGLELLREVVRRWPGTLVVVVTGYATVESAVEAMKIGAFDYVQKPFRPEELRRVLSLVSEERSFSGTAWPERDPWALANEMSARNDCDVLLVIPGPEPGSRPNPRVTVVTLSAPEPYRVIEAARDFFATRKRAGLILADATDLFLSRPVADAAAVIRDLKELANRKGPLSIGVDPRRVGGDVMAVLRQLLAAPAVHEVVEALASPIRRSILRRLEAGPASFNEAMRAAEVEDSPKLSFHLRKLVDAGLVGHAQDSYRMMAKGSHAMEALRRFENAVTAGTSAFITMEKKSS